MRFLGVRSRPTVSTVPLTPKKVRSLESAADKFWMIFELENDRGPDFDVIWLDLSICSFSSSSLEITQHRGHRLQQIIGLRSVGRHQLVRQQRPSPSSRSHKTDISPTFISAGEAGRTPPRSLGFPPTGVAAPRLNWKFFA